jgi:hypothetical protein
MQGTSMCTLLGVEGSSELREKEILKAPESRPARNAGLVGFAF